MKVKSKTMAGIAIRICPKCGCELVIIGVSPDGFDIYGCPEKECGYREDDE